MPLTDIDAQRLGDSVADKLGNRNLIINGDMRIAQRGTSESGLTDSPKFVVDRFAYRRAGAWGTNSFTMTQQSSGAPDGFKHFLRLTQSGTAAAPPTDTWCGFGHYIEGQNLVQVGFGTSGAQELTLSFYAKASQAGTYCVQLGSNASSQSFIAEYSVTTSWQLFTISIPARTTGTWNTDNNIGLLMHWVISADSNGSPSGSAGWSATNARYTTNQTEAFASNAGATFDLCGVQLEVGNTATPFEHKSFDQELTDCCRYFQKSYQYGTAIGTAEDRGAICNRSSQNTAMSQHMGFEFRHRFRTNPTVTVYSPNNGTASQVSNRGSAPTTHNSNVSVGSLFNIGETAVSAIELSTSTGPAILFHYGADAEL